MSWMHRKTLLVSQFLLLPFHQPSTTPRLSLKTQKNCPGELAVQRYLARNSNPTASAHLMSLPSAFHPGMRRQALHWLLITMPIPTPELASEEALVSVTIAGPGMGHETAGELSSLNHQERSEEVWHGAWWGAKGLELKEAMSRDYHG